MKNALFALAILCTLGASAQTTSSATTPEKTVIAPRPASPAMAPAITAPITAPAAATATTETTVVPDYLKGVSSDNIKPENFLPVLGNFKGAGTSSNDVSVTVDPANVGIVWVDGLPQGRFKALLRKSPATYKIPAQKSATGKSISEGTLYYDPSTKEMTILIGKPYNEATPEAFLTVDSKSKNKGWQYTGVKSETGAAVTPSVDSKQ
jgi:hypothetical protein